MTKAALNYFQFCFLCECNYMFEPHYEEMDQDKHANKFQTKILPLKNTVW